MFRITNQLSYVNIVDAIFARKTMINHSFWGIQTNPRTEMMGTTFLGNPQTKLQAGIIVGDVAKLRKQNNNHWLNQLS